MTELHGLIRAAWPVECMSTAVRTSCDLLLIDASEHRHPGAAAAGARSPQRARSRRRRKRSGAGVSAHTAPHARLPGHRPPCFPKGCTQRQPLTRRLCLPRPPAAASPGQAIRATVKASRAAHMQMCWPGQAVRGRFRAGLGRPMSGKSTCAGPFALLMEARGPAGERRSTGHSCERAGQTRWSAGCSVGIDRWAVALLNPREWVLRRSRGSLRP